MEPTAAEYAEMPVRITRDGSVFIGDHKIPGCIAERGVTVRCGAPDAFNLLTVEFIVGKVLQIDDPADSA